MTDAINELDEAQPYSEYDQFLGIRMKIGTKYAALYVVSTQLLRVVYLVSNVILNEIDPTHECTVQSSWNALFFVLTLIPQPLFYFKFWHKKFKQFDDRAKIGKELSLVLGVHLLHNAVIRPVLRSFLKLNLGMDLHDATHILEFVLVTLMNIQQIITIFLPLRWQNKFDQERKKIKGVPLEEFLTNAWHRDEFRTFLKDDVVVLSFYESITEFLQTKESMDQQEQRQQLNKIFKLYIEDSAPFSKKLKSTTKCIQEIQDNVRMMKTNPERVIVDYQYLGTVARKMLIILETVHYPRFMIEMYGSEG
eukprot:744649_1